MPRFALSPIRAAAALLLVAAMTPARAEPGVPPPLSPPPPPTSRPADPPATQPAPPASAPLDASRMIVRAIEDAHGANAWRAVAAVRCHLTVRFGGQQMLSGTMLYEPASGRSRIELDSGETLVFDGQRAWAAEALELPPGARFHLLTWPYFLAAPFKLSDPGAQLSSYRMLAVGQKLCRTARLTFAPGVGDTPDDWYVIHAEPQTNRLVAMAYIITYGTPTPAAEKEPHAIVYAGFRMFHGVTLPTRWTFYAWSADQGIHGSPIGDAAITGIEFVEPDEDAFDRPPGTAEARSPSS